MIGFCIDQQSPEMGGRQDDFDCMYDALCLGAISNLDLSAHICNQLTSIAVRSLNSFLDADSYSVYDLRRLTSWDMYIQVLVALYLASLL